MLPNIRVFNVLHHVTTELNERGLSGLDVAITKWRNGKSIGTFIEFSLRSIFAIKSPLDTRGTLLSVEVRFYLLYVTVFNFKPGN